MGADDYHVSYEWGKEKDLKEFEFRALNFEQAIEALKLDMKVARRSWEEGTFVVRISKTKEGDLLRFDPYLQIKNADGTSSTWKPSPNDICATDWMIIIDY